MDDTNTNNKTAVVDKQVFSAGTLSHVGSVQKERVPISAKVASEISEIIAASEKEPSVPTEVREAGVETVTDGLPLTPDHKALGIEHAKESTPVPTVPQGSVSLIKIDEVKRDIQISPAYSVRWLAELKKRVLKMFGLWKEKG